MKNKYPDNIVYNYETGEFDANKKEYPTTVSSQKFEPIVVDKTDSLKANKYFEVSKGYKCRYMEKVIKVKNEFRDKLSAITHYDGTGRLQTVNKKENIDFFVCVSLLFCNSKHRNW